MTNTNPPSSTTTTASPISQHLEPSRGPLPYCPPPSHKPITTKRFLLLALFRPIRAAHLAHTIPLTKLILLGFVAFTLGIILIPVLENIHTNSSYLLGLLPAIKHQLLYLLRMLKPERDLYYVPMLVSIYLAFFSLPLIFGYILAPRINPPNTSLAKSILPTTERLLATLPHLLLILILASIINFPLENSYNHFTRQLERAIPEPISMDYDWDTYQEQHQQWRKDTAIAWQDAPITAKLHTPYLTAMTTLTFLYPYVLMLFITRRPQQGSSSTWPATCESCNYPLPQPDLKKACPECGHPIAHSISPNTRLDDPFRNIKSIGYLKTLSLLLLAPIFMPKSLGRRIRAHDTSPHHQTLYLLTLIPLCLFCFTLAIISYQYNARTFGDRYIYVWPEITLTATFILIPFLILHHALPLIQSVYHYRRFKTHFAYPAAKIANLLTPLTTIIFIIANSAIYLLTRLLSQSNNFNSTYLFNTNTTIFHLLIYILIAILILAVLFITYLHHRLLKQLRTADR
ncbi:hypothetical protein [Poriferisphaera sp. WC338]|uniref:hypothetical protein n=1 Tax=Poriferisphaera sp. WC338 TaxID=3425129 RepID=UPI003D81B833